MSLSYTYSTLRSELTAWLEDSFEDFTASLDDIIAKAELQCVRDLDLALFDQVDGSEISTVAGEATINLAAQASGAFLLRELWVNGQFVEPRSEGYCYHYDDLTADGQPLYWCQATETTIKLAPKPDAIYSTRQIVLRRPTGLSATQPTTILSNNVGDLLFAACKALSESFDKAPEDQAVAEAEYQRILPLAREELRPLARVSYP